ncbi:thiamine-binding protein [Halorussus halophilus]|uniref:thiamine-binding protein n=1 Tax=Halorussus halophilus TaxID=2650975 RepID=UPI0013011F8B
MTVTARLEVIPTRERGMSDGVARAVDALELFDVSYETTATDTVIEADNPDEVFRAAAAAHRAVSDGRVITSLELDDQRGRSQRGEDRVAAVERRLGRPPRRERSVRFENRRRETASSRPERYHAPRIRPAPTQTDAGWSGGQFGGQTESRYLRVGGSR